jgi:hypothetical protein
MKTQLLLFASLVAGACGGRPVETPQEPAPRAREPAKASGDTHGNSASVPDSSAISGRVLLDGEPVREFAIALTIDAGFVGVYEPPRVFRSRDGRFKVPLGAKGPRDVVIVGRGFARQIILRSEIEERKTTDLGDVVVSHGDTIQGVVRDEKGLPLPNARVAVLTTPTMLSEEPKDEMRQLTIGNVLVTSDGRGTYFLEGVASNLRRDLGRPEVRAWTSDRASLPVQMPYGNATIDFNVAPAGSIEVTATGPSGSFVSVQPAGDSKTFLQPRRGDSGRGSTTTFDQVPAGEYDVSLLSPKGQLIARQRISVAGGTVTAVTIGPPSTQPSPSAKPSP